MRVFSSGFAMIVFVGVAAHVLADDNQAVKEVTLKAPNNVTIRLRMEGPYDADVPLQSVCYFKHKDAGDNMLGAALELDTRLSGAISSLRNRKEFTGEELETLLVQPSKNSLKPKLLLLIGLGDEASLSLERMERIGQAAFRETARVGATHAGFAPLLRDQGDSKLDTGEVERAVTRGMLLAYDTDKRLQKEGLAKQFTLEEWIVQAGPSYFDITKAGIQKGIDDATAAIAKRSTAKYESK
jgi:leucyl aminopeptidase